MNEWIVTQYTAQAWQEARERLREIEECSVWRSGGIVRSSEFGGGPDQAREGAHMRLSARNTLPGIIRKIEPGAVNAEITIELAPELHVVSVITLDAVNSLKLKVGERAYAVIKASSVMVAVD
jgi:molybdopterin-binding protein